MKEKDFKQRIVSEQQCMKRITNNDLVCKDCAFQYDDTIKLGNTSVCEKFYVKPPEVLLGEDCIEYEKSNGSQ